jgi:hypothetical protein
MVQIYTFTMAHKKALKNPPTQYVENESDGSLSSLSECGKRQTITKRSVSNGTSELAGLKRSAESTESEGEERILAKREYNRLSAARARKRQKELISDLQRQVKSVTDELNDQRRVNEAMQARMVLLMEQNQDISMHRLMLQKELQHYQATLSTAALPPYTRSAMSAQQLSRGNLATTLGLLNSYPGLR